LGEVLVCAEVCPREKNLIADHQYEVCFFLDGESYAEEEGGYSPHSWLWNLQDDKDGEHVLIVNISSFKEQTGIASRKVKVEK